MTTDTLIQLAQLGTILIGSLGIGVAMRGHRRQLNAQMFIEFSARFQAVLRSMPPEAWLGKGGDSIPPRTEELTRNSLQWFHLIASLHYLHKLGYISRDLWKPSQLGMKRLLQSPFFQREWLAVEPAFSHYPEYCRFVYRLMGTNPRTPAGLNKDLDVAQLQPSEIRGRCRCGTNHQAAG